MVRSKPETLFVQYRVHGMVADNLVILQGGRGAGFVQRSRGFNPSAENLVSEVKQLLQNEY